ncbi:MAG: hypothetical protein SVV03_02425 [Candidatus Nanohaloarchaea archaeon]|nr:hypothetical protein [Candidatus Nanohaloarchaea archaeon]
MAKYCTPLEVWEALGAAQDKSEDFTGISDGEDIDLAEKNLIGKAFPAADNSFSSDQDVIVLDSNGNIQSTSDYSVDLRDGVITWNGGTTIDPTVRYKVPPVKIPNRRVVDFIRQASSRIDNRTETTFDGLETGYTEVLDGKGTGTAFYPLEKRPVDNIQSLKVNRADLGDADDFETLTEGRAADFIQEDNIGFRFTSSSVAAEKEPENIEVTYDYGFTNIPDEIKELCIGLVIKKFFQNNVIEEGIEGRDDFNPNIKGGFLNDLEDIFDRYSVEKYSTV